MFKKLCKQDRQGVRKPSDVERKYNLGEVVETVRVIQEDSVPENELDNYYTKNEIDYKLSSIVQSGDYRIVDDVVEWINPPMEVDTEYRTTERWLGKPVYTKAVMQDVSLRGSSDEEKDTYYRIELPTSTPNFDKCIRYSGHTSGREEFFTHITLPYFDYNGVDSPSYVALRNMDEAKITVQVYDRLFMIDTLMYIQVWYTKTE